MPLKCLRNQLTRPKKSLLPHQVGWKRPHQVAVVLTACVGWDSGVKALTQLGLINGT
jgi:hypothetical protein